MDFLENKSISKPYNVIIVGGGLAGLSVARGLGNIDKVLLVDKRPIGSDPNPPHETLVPFIEGLGYRDAIIEKFYQMNVRTSIGKNTLKVFIPHCTLDYSKLCELISAKSRAEVRVGSVEPLDSNRVRMDGEILEANFIVDCSGWRSVIASSLLKNNFRPISMTSTMATTVPFKNRGDIDSPTYFFDHRIIPNGGGFVIPFGDQALVGLGSYVGDKDLKQNFNKLLKIVGVQPGIISRDFIPNHGLRPETIGNLFVVGDAAGQSKPIRGKGILRSLLYGMKCGNLIKQVIEGHITIQKAKMDYHEYIMQEKPVYNMLKQIQNLLVSTPGPLQSFGASIFTNDYLGFFWDKMY